MEKKFKIGTIKAIRLLKNYFSTVLFLYEKIIEGLRHNQKKAMIS